MLYKFLLLLISFLMIISCSESDVSTTELAPISTPIPASTPLPDIKQVPTVEPIVEVKEEPKDDDFQEGITFDRRIAIRGIIYRSSEGEESQKKMAESYAINIDNRLKTYEESQKKKAESTGPESTDTPIMTYEEFAEKMV